VIRLPASIAILAMAANPVALAQAAALDTLGGRTAVVLVTLLAVVLCVVAHYESLSFLSGFLRRIHIAPRPRILLLIFSILGIHVVEIWVFGAAYYGLALGGGTGALVAAHPIELLDNVYFSAVCFTTLGLGDVVPLGAVRFLAGTEALTGFVLLTWSASFTFVEMQRFWKT
jgi:hypothetical protein